MLTQLGEGTAQVREGGVIYYVPVENIEFVPRHGFLYMDWGRTLCYEYDVMPLLEIENDLIIWPTQTFNHNNSELKSGSMYRPLTRLAKITLMGRK